MVEYQTAKDNVDRILGTAPPKKEQEKIESPVADHKKSHTGQNGFFLMFGYIAKFSFAGTLYLQQNLNC